MRLHFRRPLKALQCLFDSARKLMMGALVSLMATSNGIADDFLFGFNRVFVLNTFAAEKGAQLSIQAGANSFRSEVWWTDVELKDVGYKPNWRGANMMAETKVAASKGLKPVIILAYGNSLYGGGQPQTDEAINGFAEYCRYMANEFASYKPVFEIWNEWNGGLGNADRAKGTATSYVKMAKPCAAAVKAVNPETIVLGGSTSGYDSPWTDEAIDQGLLAFVDGFAVHPYTFYRIHNPDLRTAEHSYDYLLRLNEKLKPTGTSIYVTEMGWPTSEDHHGFSYEDSGLHSLKYFLLLKTLDSIKGLHFFELVDKSTANKQDREQQFGFWNDEYKEKPAANYLILLHQEVPQVLSGTVDGLLTKCTILRHDLQGGGKLLTLWGEGSATVDINRSGDSPVDDVFGGEQLKSGVNSISLTDKPRSYILAEDEFTAGCNL
ncbi:glycoside hydrolase family 5 protein [Neiella marina]|uniref:Glycoside hydrolase family 5 protein n=1 Tax=Neiella holothuriorum TaxID=2870530 RepID=A0ABS7EE09_9GAMM|nr:cellulase family glycosylhydrolase [Neiella holothuriorum]MBW8190579.1 glycoside hydrolase family 5 protein [Neiella holothuriorum]